MTNRIVVLAIGDLLAFVLFGGIGLASHEDAVTAKTIARAILVFPVAWFVIAPWLGAFSERAMGGREPLVRIAAIWLVAGVAALCARALIFDRSLFNAFFVIALVGNGLLLIGWRAAYGAWLAGRASRATG
jgi:hypothetical protein